MISPYNISRKQRLTDPKIKIFKKRKINKIKIKINKIKRKFFKINYNY